MIEVVAFALVASVAFVLIGKTMPHHHHHHHPKSWKHIDDASRVHFMRRSHRGGSDLGSDWHVFLGSSPSAAATLAATGVAAGADAVASGAIDGDQATGAWAATLHGSDNDTTLDRTKYPLARYPVADVAGVAGWFRAAAGDDAALAGAFGAACTTGTMCAK